MNPSDRHSRLIPDLLAEEALCSAFYDLWAKVKAGEYPRNGDTMAQSSQAHSDLQLFDLRYSLVLEQFQTYYLLQEPSTKRFYVCSDETDTPLFQTDDWAEAYRMWFSLRQQHILNTENDGLLNSLHEVICRHQNDPSFGQLIYCRDHQFRGLLQYAVCLSSELALQWAPLQPQPSALGTFVLEKVSRRRYSAAKWVDSAVPHKLADALHHSIDVFHQRWQYELYQFNSEHWARLAATGQCCSFQVEDLCAYGSQVSAMADTTTEPIVWEHNSEAATALTLAIAQGHPDTLTP
jgi:hypothetical protein